jgi:hypothetical protein
MECGGVTHISERSFISVQNSKQKVLITPPQNIHNWYKSAERINTVQAQRIKVNIKYQKKGKILDQLPFKKIKCDML